MDKGMDPATRFKFRAWDPVNSRMYKAPFIAFEPDGTHEAYEDAREWEDCIRRKSILMQWTGLKDRNGVEIYEGDILEFSPGDYYNLGRVLRGVVVFIGGSFGMEIGVEKGWHDLGQSIAEDDSAEVLGNIYEHPALLSAPPKEGSK